MRQAQVSSISLMARDEIILDAAERLFFERGFNGVGVDEIGQAAGVTGSAIYRHFDSKDEILAMLFDRVIDALLMTPLQDRGDPAEELYQLATSHAELARSHRQLAGIWEREHRALAEPYKRRYHRRMRKYIDRWVDCLDRLYPGHSADYLRAAVRAVHALLLSDATRPRPAASNEYTSELLVNMAVRSLSALADR